MSNVFRKITHFITPIAFPVLYDFNFEHTSNNQVLQKKFASDKKKKIMKFDIFPSHKMSIFFY